MRNRITGAIGLILGLAVTSLVLLGQDPIQIKPLLGGLVFIVLGGYYLFFSARGDDPTKKQ